MYFFLISLRLTLFEERRNIPCTTLSSSQINMHKYPSNNTLSPSPKYVHLPMGPQKLSATGGNGGKMGTTLMPDV